VQDFSQKLDGVWDCFFQGGVAHLEWYEHESFGEGGRGLTL